VSERGDLLYSFPNGFKSRYKGFGPSLRRLWKTITRGAVKTGKLTFKVWILVTLFGYFFLFLALALIALFASVMMRAGARAIVMIGGEAVDFGGFMAHY